MAIIMMMIVIMYAIGGHCVPSMSVRNCYCSRCTPYPVASRCLKWTSLGQDAYGLHMVAYGGMGSKNRNGAAPTIPSVSRMSRLSQEWDQDSRNVLVINQLSSIRTRELVGCSVCHCKKVVRDKSRMGVGSWQTHACLPPQMI